MADTIGYIRPASELTIHLNIRRLVHSSSGAALADGKIDEDVAAASSIWSRVADIQVVSDSLQDWHSDYFYSLTSRTHFAELEAEHWVYGQTWINVYYASTSSWAAGVCSFPDYSEVHAIFLTDASTDDWRGVALAHELGHYLDLRHPKDSKEDCSDTDGVSFDAGNLMNQGADGRTSGRVSVAV